MKAELKHEELTGKIIGCTMKLHRYFGPGFPEIIYQRALMIELQNIGLRGQAEVEKDVYYEEHFVGKRRLDLIVEEQVLVELKAVSELDGASYSKMVSYLKVFKMEVGLLLNFGMPSLQFKRFVSTEKNP